MAEQTTRITCDLELCFAGDDGPCQRGFDHPTLECPHVTTPSDDLPAQTDEGVQNTPWSGLPLGSADAEVVAALGRSKVVALVGPSGAGKTTALAALWIQLRRGHLLAGATFAGSYTLVGWHDIARDMDWEPNGRRDFPPHTTNDGGREPSLLHVALERDGMITDVLFSDLPGELFTDWAVAAPASSAVEWLVEHADLFVVFGDTAAFAGDRFGPAVSNHEQLAHRVQTSAEGRPVLALRSKADEPLSTERNDRLYQIERRYTDREPLRLSAFAPETGDDTGLAALDGIVDMAISPVRRASVVGRRPTEWDPLLHYRSAIS